MNNWFLADGPAAKPAAGTQKRYYNENGRFILESQGLYAAKGASAFRSNPGAIHETIASARCGAVQQVSLLVEHVKDSAF
jgi:hypothetical protein